MKSEVRLQKFHTVDVHYSDLGNACYLCQEGDLSQSIRSTTQIWEVISTVQNFCTRSSDVIWRGPVVTRRNVGSFLMLTKHSFNPLSPNSDQHQFYPNNIHTLSRDKLWELIKRSFNIFLCIQTWLHLFKKTLYSRNQWIAFLIITDSLLCPWGKKSLMYSLN